MRRSTSRILIVEDEDAHAELTKRALRKAGNESVIDVVSDGEEALDYLFNRGRFSDKNKYVIPELILLDIRLPGINGIEVLKEIKNNTIFRQIVVIMLSTSDRREDICESYFNYANSYIKKPVGYKEFEEKVRQIDSYWMRISERPVTGIREAVRE
jgi:two-component system, response regulator